jgi:hypothetical protein
MDWILENLAFDMLYNLHNMNITVCRYIPHVHRSLWFGTSWSCFFKSQNMLEYVKYRLIGIFYPIWCTVLVNYKHLKYKYTEYATPQYLLAFDLFIMLFHDLFCMLSWKNLDSESWPVDLLPTHVVHWQFMVFLSTQRTLNTVYCSKIYFSWKKGT